MSRNTFQITLSEETYSFNEKYIKSAILEELKKSRSYSRRPFKISGLNEWKEMDCNALKAQIDVPLYEKISSGKREHTVTANVVIELPSKIIIKIYFFPEK